MKMMMMMIFFLTFTNKPRWSRSKMIKVRASLLLIHKSCLAILFAFVARTSFHCIHFAIHHHHHHHCWNLFEISSLLFPSLLFLAVWFIHKHSRSLNKIIALCLEFNFQIFHQITVLIFLCGCLRAFGSMLNNENFYLD